MITTILFGVTVAIILVSAFYVVRSPDLVRAVLWLGLSLLGTALLYGLLQSPFLAGVQVLTYVGGVVTLLIFGVMVTRRHTGEPIKAEGVGGFRAFLVAGGFFAIMAWAIVKTGLPATGPLPAVSTAQLGRTLLDDYFFPFEVASLLLLAAIVGAVVLARRKDPEPSGAHGPIIRSPGPGPQSPGVSQ